MDKYTRWLNEEIAKAQQVLTIPLTETKQGAAT